MLKKFLNIHQGLDIYIVASGKSLDFFDLTFLENKISIGINQIYKKIKTNYLIIKDLFAIKKCIKFLKDDQFLFISKGNFGESNELNKIFIENNYKKNNIIVFDHEKNKHRIKEYPENKDHLIVSHSTITSAIHLAAYMGAKNIILIGHDCGSINGEFNCSFYHDENTYKIAWKNGIEDYKEWLTSIEKDTIRIKKIIKEKYNCNLYSLNPFINFNLEGNIYERFNFKNIHKIKNI